MEMSIQMPSNIIRITRGKRTKFVTERRDENMRYSSEYRGERAEAKMSRMLARRDVPGAENPDAALRLALLFLALLAAQENSVLEMMCERNRVAEKADENLRKHRKETVEALETFFHSW
jgi:hypothetical protein